MKSEELRVMSFRNPQFFTLNFSLLTSVSRTLLLLAMAWAAGCSHTQDAKQTASNEACELCNSIAITPQGTIKAVLLPYNIPAGSRQPMGVSAPAYLEKQLSMGFGATGFSYGGGKGFSLRQAISQMSKLSGISIEVRDGIPATHTKYWDEIPVPHIHGNNTFGHFLKEIISYMQEVGIPVPRNMRNDKYEAFRVVAIFGSKKLVIDSFLCALD
ncbi:MAG: hypothetical protein NTY01_07165 [Verrucomicrobia bacterium]|nr:hypothetical protein [Verrucomicrobiota bacterium]